MKANRKIFVTLAAFVMGVISIMRVTGAAAWAQDLLRADIGFATYHTAPR